MKSDKKGFADGCGKTADRKGGVRPVQQKAQLLFKGIKIVAGTRATSMEALEQKSEKAQQDVAKTKERYDKAAATLENLLNKRDALRHDELVNIIMNSGKTYEEILQFFREAEQVG